MPYIPDSDLPEVPYTPVTTRENKIEPSLPHDAPRIPDTGPISIRMPPPGSTSRNLFLATANARDLLSGDQNGWPASSVSGSSRAAPPSSGRTQSPTFPLTEAVYAAILPSGEIARSPKGPPPKTNRPFGGGSIWSRSGCPFGGAWRKYETAHPPNAPNASAAMATAIHARRLVLPAIGCSS